jgi:hypothetical protein
MWIFILVLLPAIVEEMFALNDFLSKPLDFLVQWRASGTFDGRIKFAILLFLYLAPLIILWTALASLAHRHRQQATAPPPQYQSPNDYDSMIADLIETIPDRTVSADLKADKVNRLFDALLDDVSNLFHLNRIDVRIVLVTNDRGGRQRLTSWRWGRETATDQDRIDLKAIGILLETAQTYPTWEQAKEKFPHSDSDTLLFFRNRGELLKLGCLIAISQPVDLESRLEEWGQIVYPFTMLGHMDKLVRFVVNYK